LTDDSRIITERTSESSVNSTSLQLYMTGLTVLKRIETATLSMLRPLRLRVTELDLNPFVVHEIRASILDASNQSKLNWPSPLPEWGSHIFFRSLSSPVFAVLQGRPPFLVRVERMCQEVHRLVSAQTYSGIAGNRAKSLIHAVNYSSCRSALFMFFVIFAVRHEAHSLLLSSLGGWRGQALTSDSTSIWLNPYGPCANRCRGESGNRIVNWEQTYRAKCQATESNQSRRV